MRFSWYHPHVLLVLGSREIFAFTQAIIVGIDFTSCNEDCWETFIIFSIIFLAWSTKEGQDI